MIGRRLITWNGKDLPRPASCPLANRIVHIDYEAPELSPEEEAGIQAALDSYR
jgi:hypothetical protein